MPAPAFDDDVGFLQAVEDLAVEQFVPQAGVEAFRCSRFQGLPGAM